jgi:hypothetical protein
MKSPDLKSDGYSDRRVIDEAMDYKLIGNLDQPNNHNGKTY